METWAGWFNLLIPLFSFTGNVLFQVLWFRSRPDHGLLKSEYLGFAVGLALFLGLQPSSHTIYSQSPVDALSIAVANLLVYSALSYCYFHFINLCLTARRIRLIRDLFVAPDGLTLDQILENYNARDILAKRIQRLLGSGQIVEQNGRYLVGKPAVLFAAWFMVILKFIFLGKGSEYD